MEVSRVQGKDKIRWLLKGEMDEDSVLRFESLILNSQDRGADVTIDLSGLTGMPNMGARGFSHVATRLEDNGSRVQIICADENISRRLKISGTVCDQ
jgi:anti-anti-sigma regulatory factor